MSFKEFFKPSLIKIFLIVFIFIIMFIASIVFGTEATLDYRKPNLVDYLTGIHYLRVPGVWSNLHYIYYLSVLLYYYLLSCLISPLIKNKKPKK